MTVAPTDPEAADAMFLDNHPGWTWRDLQDTPVRVIAHLNQIHSIRASEARKRRR